MFFFVFLLNNTNNYLFQEKFHTMLYHTQESSENCSFIVYFISYQKSIFVYVFFCLSSDIINYKMSIIHLHLFRSWSSSYVMLSNTHTSFSRGENVKDEVLENMWLQWPKLSTTSAENNHVHKKYTSVYIWNSACVYML